MAIGARGLLIRGASGSGKSALALALVAASAPARRIVLVGDDRVLLRRDAAGSIVARPHPRIAGFVERRGLGLVAVPWQGCVRLAACVALGTVRPLAPPDGEAEAWLRALPVLPLDPFGRDGTEEPIRRVLGWWSTLAPATGDAADRTQVA